MKMYLRDSLAVRRQFSDTFHYSFSLYIFSLLFFYILLQNLIQYPTTTLYVHLRKVFRTFRNLKSSHLCCSFIFIFCQYVVVGCIQFFLFYFIVWWYIHEMYLCIYLVSCQITGFVLTMKIYIYNVGEYKNRAFNQSSYELYFGAWNRKNFSRKFIMFALCFFKSLSYGLYSKYYDQQMHQLF